MFMSYEHSGKLWHPDTSSSLQSSGQSSSDTCSKLKTKEYGERRCYVSAQFYFCNKYQNVFFAYWIKIPGHGFTLHATSLLLSPRQSTPPKRAGCSTFLVIVFVPPPQGSVQLVASSNCDHLQLTLKRWTKIDCLSFWQNSLYAENGVVINLV